MEPKPRVSFDKAEGFARRGFDAEGNKRAVLREKSVSHAAASLEYSARHSIASSFLRVMT